MNCSLIAVYVKTACRAIKNVDSGLSLYLFSLDFTCLPGTWDILMQNRIGSISKEEHWELYLRTEREATECRHV